MISCLRIINYMFFAKKANKQFPFIVFDIGSASISAAIVVADEKNDAVEIIYQTRISMNSHRYLNYERLFSAMLTALKAAAENIEQNRLRIFSENDFNLKNIKDIFCVFSSLWCVYGISVANFIKEKSFIISERFISDNIKNSETELKKLLQNKLNQNNIPDPILMEKNIIQTLLNGYNVNKPYGKETNRIDITLFMSMISDEIRRKVRDIIEKIFNTDNILYNSFALASFSVTRDVFSAEKDFLLMDISGEVSDIMLIRDDVIVKTSTFPLGSNFLIRKTAEALNIIPEEAHSLIRLFFEQKGLNTEHQDIRKALIAIKEEWLYSFRKILSDFAGKLSLPKTIFLLVDTDIASWFIDTIKNDEFSAYTLTQQQFTIVELRGEIFRKYCYTKNKDKKDCDSFLAIEALFARKV